MCLILKPSLLPTGDHIHRELFDNCQVDRLKYWVTFQSYKNFLLKQLFKLSSIEPSSNQTNSIELVSIDGCVHP